MKHAARNLTAVTLLSLSFISVAHAQQPAKQDNAPPPQAGWMTTRQARRAVALGLKHAATNPPTKISNIRFSENSVEFNIDETYVFKKWGACLATGKTRIDLRTLGVLTTKREVYRKKVYPSHLYMDGKDLSSTVFNFGAFGGLCGKHLNILGIFAFDTVEKAQAFADAMNRLSYIAGSGAKEQQDAEWRIFQQKAAAWRALSPRPPLAEGARQQRVLAENSVHEKNLDAAIEHYEDGLDIDPLWPEGHFNAALLYAEQNQYSDAIAHMRAYLELVPNASDAEAARDQILIWQDKLKQK